MIDFKKYVQVIEEGGAYGHMANIHEDTTLTFGELKNLIEGLLSGKLEAEFKEKTDGQALAVSMKNGNVIFARNKGQLLNGGKNAMKLNDVLKTFENRGDLTDAFSFAAKDITKALLGLSRKIQDERFNDGHRWLNFEIIWPETTNVIPYDLRVIKLHNFIEYDDEGNAIDSDFDDFAVQIQRDLETVNATIQNKFTIGTMPRLALSKINDFSSKRDQYISQLNQLLNEYELSDNSTLGDLYENSYKRIINTAAESYNYPAGGDLMNTLVNRWVYNVKQPTIVNVKKAITDKQFADWIGNHDKTDHKTTFDSIREPIKSMFINVATDVIRNMTEFLAASPDESVQHMRRRLKNVEQKIKQTGDTSLIAQVDRELRYIERAGGFENIFPTEGLTFAIKRGDDDHPYVYKLTGTFAPVNQILGKEPGRFEEDIVQPKYNERGDWRGIFGPI
jgi:hypothetical protein